MRVAPRPSTSRGLPSRASVTVSRILACSTLWLIGFSPACASDSAAHTPIPESSSANPELDNSATVFTQYIDASNRVDYSDPTTFDPVLAFLTGDQLVFETDLLASFHRRGWTISGTVVISAIDRPATSKPPLSAQLHACLDTTTLQYRDVDNVIRVPPDNTFINTVTVSFRRDSTLSSWLIDDLQVSEGGKGACLIDLP